jgi:DNA polymerase-3 subunit epsilon
MDMHKWQLDRPLAVFDIESTGTNPRADRIIELSIVKILPKGGQQVKSYRCNPGIPIPAEATAIHGITDADIAAAPLFKTLAPEIYRLLEDCDLAGYNIIRFDVPMLIEEFLRASINFPLNTRRIIDAQRIYHKREPRDLKAALAFYCNELYLEGHRAESDALATVRVLEGQFERYSDLPRNMDELAKYCDLRDPSWVDRDGKLRWTNGEITINFGRKKGERLGELARHDPGFLRWMLKGDFASDTKDIVAKVLEGKRIDPVGTALGDQLAALKEPEGETS